MVTEGVKPWDRSKELQGWGLNWCGLKEGAGSFGGGREAWLRQGYLLLLARHKNLVARGCPKAQLVDARWLLLGVDLHSDPHLKWGLLCEGGKGT